MTTPAQAAPSSEAPLNRALVALTAVAHAYIQRERMRRGAAGLTFPQVRAIVQEIFTALLFAAKPRYMHWMEQAKHELQLRI